MDILSSNPTLQDKSITTKNSRIKNFPKNFIPRTIPPECLLMSVLRRTVRKDTTHPKKL
jgi:hypothetical protein